MRIIMKINVFASEHAEGALHVLVCVYFCLLTSLDEASSWIRIHRDM